jgi:hypothetical protein
MQTVVNSVPYSVFENKNGFLRSYDQEYFDNSKFSNWTETRYFKPSMIQECMFSEFSDKSWDISASNLIQMKRDLLKVVNKDQPNHVANFSLSLDYAFNRASPPEAMKSSKRIEKHMNYSLLHDCNTGLQI